MGDFGDRAYLPCRAWRGSRCYLEVEMTGDEEATFSEGGLDKNLAIQVLMQIVSRLYCTVGTSTVVSSKAKLRGTFWWGKP